MVLNNSKHNNETMKETRTRYATGKNKQPPSFPSLPSAASAASTFNLN
jgi:hypothetical protein